MTIWQQLRYFLSFKACWFLLVLFPKTAMFPVLIYLGLSLWFLSVKKRVAVLMITLCGVLIDYLLVQLGMFSFIDSGGLPFWMWLLWGCFALVLVQVMAQWLQRVWLGAGVGLVFGPMAYWAGASLGGQLIYPSLSQLVMVLAPIWAVLMALVVYLQFLWRCDHEV